MALREVKAKSPTRVDLAGGTLDLWPLYNFVGRAATVNFAINIWTEAVMIEREDQRIIIESADLQKTFEFKNLGELLLNTATDFRLFQVFFSFYRPSKGFTLKTRSESPVGAGLGGSSSLLISMQRAFHEFEGLKLPDPVTCVNIAHNIEAEILMTPTGTQDYFPAVCGGLNIIKYQASGIEHECIKLERTPFDDHWVVFYTGKSHHSGINNFEVLKNCVQKEANTLSALRKLKEVADMSVQIVHQKEWSAIPRLLAEEYEARQNLSSLFVTPEIRKLADSAVRAGAEGVKICGAGGGGCVALWVSPLNKNKVVESCQRAGFQLLNVAPVRPM